MVTFADDYVRKPGEIDYTVIVHEHDKQYYVDFVDTYLSKDHPLFESTEKALAWARLICQQHVYAENAKGVEAQYPADLDNGDVGPCVGIHDIAVIDQIRYKREKEDAKTVTHFDHG